MARGKVITTHLRTGDPNGIRTVFISNKICEMIVFPKSEFDAVSKMEESSRPALCDTSDRYLFHELCIQVASVSFLFTLIYLPSATGYCIFQDRRY